MCYKATLVGLPEFIDSSGGLFKCRRVHFGGCEEGGEWIRITSRSDASREARFEWCGSSSREGVKYYLARF